MTIIANPSRVCEAHAREFWTGLLAYSHSRSGLCVKEREVCGCPLCEEMARSFAIKNASPSPEDHADFEVALAS